MMLKLFPKMNSATKWAIVLSFLFVALVARGLLTRGFVNVGNIAFVRLLTSPIESGEFHDHGATAEATAEFFAKAVSLSEDDFGARKSLGRLLLFRHDSVKAAEILKPMVDSRASNTPFFVDVLRAYSSANWERELLDLETSDGWMSVSEAVLCRMDWGNQTKVVSLAYMAWSRRQEGSRSRTEQKSYGAPFSEQISCESWMVAKGDSVGLSDCREGLTHFGLDAILERSGSLSEAALEAIPTLIRKKLWPPTFAQNVISWLVWRYYQTDALEKMLRILVEEHPESPEWSQSLGEFFHRRANWEQASIYYRRSLEQDATRHESLLRLGMIYEAMADGSEDRQEALRQAKRWYERYIDLRGGDLLAGGKLLRVCRELGEYSCDGLAEVFAERTDLAASVSRLLARDSSEFRLGPNLSGSGGFDHWETLPAQQLDRPLGWDISNMAYAGGSFNEGSFIAGPELSFGWDSVSARITGLWLYRLSDIERGKFGFWVRGHGGLHLEPATPYAITFYYKTKGQQVGPSVWMSPENRVLLHNVSASSDYPLPQTNGEWWRFVAVAWNRNTENKVARPLLRTAEVGDVLIDQFGLFKVVLDDPSSLDESVRVRFEKFNVGQS